MPSRLTPGVAIVARGHRGHRFTFRRLAPTALSSAVVSPGGSARVAVDTLQGVVPSRRFLKPWVNRYLRTCIVRAGALRALRVLGRRQLAVMRREGSTGRDQHCLQREVCPLGRSDSRLFGGSPRLRLSPQRVHVRLQSAHRCLQLLRLATARLPLLRPPLYLCPYVAQMHVSGDVGLT